MTVLTRFKHREIDPTQAIPLRPDHPALKEARSIFPKSLTASMDSPRFLISGHNNTKLGKAAQKGERAGWPIFQLTLEERATCPRSCFQWSMCYGNAMPYARRHKPDADFIWLLQAEVATIARQFPAGLIVRLHVLGDFFSVEYVRVWAGLLGKFPQLHIFGYTARRLDAPDTLSREIAAEIEALTAKDWSRFAIRTSHRETGPQRSVVVDADPARPDVIVCPAQSNATEACGSCGLCWAPGARSKTIAFLRHGMTARGRRGPRSAVAKPSRVIKGRPTPAGLDPEQVETILAMAGRHVSASTICSIFEITPRQLKAVAGPLFDERAA